MSILANLLNRVKSLEARVLPDDSDDTPMKWVGVEGYAGDPDFEARVTSAEAEAQRTGARLMVVSKQRWPGDL